MKTLYQISFILISIFLFTNCEEDDSSLNGDIVYGSFTDTKDNHVYKTISIGDDEWFAEDYAYIDSTISLSGYIIAGTDGYYSFSNALKFTPKGCRLPNIDEWNNLLNSVDSHTQLLTEIKTAINLSFSTPLYSSYQNGYWVNKSYSCNKCPLKYISAEMDKYCYLYSNQETNYAISAYPYSTDSIGLEARLKSNLFRVRYIVLKETDK